MIELKNNELKFSFPDVHEDAKLTIRFQRTLRIPDDDRTYPLPPGLGNFPLVHVDDYSDNVPDSWTQHGGVIMPMYQAEAMWLFFQPTFVPTRGNSYPFAIKISTGKIDAITGAKHSNGLHSNPQDYAISPNQPWLDGYCVKKGIIRQFVAMPLGEGYTAEEQITKTAEHGGIQIVVYPMKADRYEQRFPKRSAYRSFEGDQLACCYASGTRSKSAQMGLAPGGKMKQEIYKDPFGINEWDTNNFSRCFVHITNSLMWEHITGQQPPHMPPSAQNYSAAGLPWFDYYSDDPALAGSAKLGNLKSVQKMTKGTQDEVKNAACFPQIILNLKSKLKGGKVREGDF